MRTLPIFLLLVVTLAVTSAWGQSGWTQEKKELYAQVSATFFSSDDYYGLNGAANALATTFRQQALNLYAEYGFTHRFTFLLNSSVLRVNSFETTEFLAAPGDLGLGLKYALSKKIPVSISLMPEIPISKKDNFVNKKEPNELGFIERVNLATTDGEINLWTILAISSPIPSGWFNLFGGYNLRSNGFSDQIRSGLELGYQPIQKFYAKAGFNFLGSLGAAKANVPFFRGEGTKFSAAYVGVGWQVGERVGLVGEYWRSLGFGVKPKNAYIGPVYSIGVNYKIKK